MWNIIKKVAVQIKMQICCVVLPANLTEVKYLCRRGKISKILGLIVWQLTLQNYEGKYVCGWGKMANPCSSVFRSVGLVLQKLS